MNVQPTPSADCMPHGARRAVPAFATPASQAARLLVSWPIELEVEPWRP